MTSQSTNSGLPPVYDHDGNLIENAGHTQVYEYDAWGHLVGVHDNSGNSSNLYGAQIVGYAYDALGRRMDEHVYNLPGGGSENYHLYLSAQGQVIEERAGLDPSTAVLTYKNVWGLAYVNELVLRDQFNSDGSIAQRLYVEQDANYNVVAIIDPNEIDNGYAGVVERYVYDLYGNVTVLNPNWTAASGNTSAYVWRYLFQGGRFDTATGFYGFQNRDYIPIEGRWAEHDPIGLARGNNDYGFAGASPTN